VTEENTSQAEEGVVDELLAGRWDPTEILRPVGGDETQQEIRRECLEVLGLLARSLEPREPSADLKRRLMAEVGASRKLDTRGLGAESEGMPALKRLEETLPVEVVRSESGASDESSEQLGQRWGRGQQHQRHQKWMLRLAAAMAFFALGLAGWQAFRVGGLERTVGRQAVELEAARAGLAGIGDSAEALASANAKLALLTSPGSEFCALKPGRDSRMQLARGTLVMHPDAQSWFMKVVGLEPSTEGFRYQVWYLTEEGPVAAASFGFDSVDAVVEVMTSRGPVGVQAVMVTLEPLGSEVPSSPALLYGDERMQIL